MEYQTCDLLQILRMHLLFLQQLENQLGQMQGRLIAQGKKAAQEVGSYRKRLAELRRQAQEQYRILLRRRTCVPALGDLHCIRQLEQKSVRLTYGCAALLQRLEENQAAELAGMNCRQALALLRNREKNLISCFAGIDE